MPALLGIGWRGYLEANKLHLAKDHPLVDQLGERFRSVNMPAIEEDLVPEPRIQQMKHSVFGPSHVEVDRHPVFLLLRIAKLLPILQIEIAKVVPARAGPLRHRVSFAAITLAVAFDFEPCGRLAQRGLGLAAGPKVRQIGKPERQLAFIERPYLTCWFASLVEFVKNGERFAPVTLAAEQPIAQFVID